MTEWRWSCDFRFPNRPSGVKRFQTIVTPSNDLCDFRNGSSASFWRVRHESAFPLTASRSRTSHYDDGPILLQKSVDVCHGP